MGDDRFKGGENFVRKWRGIDWPAIQDVSQSEPNCAALRNGIPVANSELNNSGEFLPLAIGESPGNFLGVVGSIEHLNASPVAEAADGSASRYAAQESLR